MYIKAQVLQLDMLSSKARLSPHWHTQPAMRAGLPITSAYAGTSLVTSAPAAIIEYSPIVLPASRMAPAPIEAPVRTNVGTSQDRVLYLLRTCGSLGDLGRK